MSKSDSIWFSRKMLLSKAYKELSPMDRDIFHLFLMRKQVSKPNRKNRSEWVITNNGEIIFTYNEAEEKGFSRATFKRAITRLIKNGLLDISYQGTGRHKDFSKYAISDRWKGYGTDNFIKKDRPKQRRDTTKLMESVEERRNKKLDSMANIE